MGPTRALTKDPYLTHAPGPRETKAGGPYAIPRVPLHQAMKGARSTYEPIGIIWGS